MIKEEKLNLIILLVLFVIPFLAYLFNEPYLTTLTTKIVILSIAGIGLNFILGYGGLVSFGHAAFFGIGGYVTGILASHAQNSEQMFFFLQLITFFSEGKTFTAFSKSLKIKNLYQ